MKRTTLVISLILILACGLFAGELKKLSLEQVYLRQGEQLTQSPPRVLGWADDQHYYKLKQFDLLKVNARTGKSETLLEGMKFMPLAKQGLSLMDAKDNTKDRTKYLMVKDGDIYYLDAAAPEPKPVRVTETKCEEQNPKFSPDGSKIAYTMGGNLYAYNIATKKTIRLTNDGSEEILNGYASWVYYEEILGRGSHYRSFWWSGDNNKIVFIRFDQSKVPFFTLFRAPGDYGTLEKERYPKPGYPNPEVKIGVADVNAETVEWVPFEDKNEHYLTFPRWNKNNRGFYFEWMNRDQNHLKILYYDLASKTVKTRYEEQQKTWIDFLENDDWVILDRNELLVRSSKSGWYHIYHIAADNKIRPVTTGEWSVESIEYADAKKKKIFFTGSKEKTTETHLYKTDFKGKRIKRLTGEAGYHRVNLSPKGSYFTDTYSSLNTPWRMALKRSNGKLVKLLGDTASPKLKEYKLGKQEIFYIKTSEGYELPATWILPPDFDKTKKYPVVFNIYGGPGGGSVRNMFPFRGLGQHYMAQLGIIAFSVDHRGSGHFGKKGMDLMYRNLGKVEMQDYIESVKYLRTLPFVDAQRIGIAGGSYGGYITAMALTYGAEYFQYGQAGASVMDWALYDSVYTERYMDTPKDNPEGYKNASVFTYLDKLKNHSLLVTHGTMDDNVHMQNSMQFLDKALDAGKIFEFMVYPGERHGIRKKRSTWNLASLDFWMRKFFGKTVDDLRTKTTK